MAHVCLAGSRGRPYTGSMSTETQDTASEGSSNTGARGVALSTAAILLPLGMVVYAVSTMAHPAREDPNSYAPVFTEYAASSTWIAVSIALYLLAGACWLPVVWMQIKMRDMAAIANANGTELPPRYWAFLKWWVALGIVAFMALVVVFYLMVAKPA